MRIEWKDIKFTDFDGTEYDYSGLYKINNKGDVYSYTTEKILSKCKDKDGYCRAVLSKNGKVKTFKVHRLVAFMFIEILDKDKQYVNHKDEEKGNNNVDNLEWCTVSENNNHGSRQQRVHNKRKQTMSSQEWKERNSGANNKASKKVVSVNIYDHSVKIYDSMKQACCELGKTESAISNAVRKKSVTGNCLWFKETEYRDVANNQDFLLKMIEHKKERYLEYYKH